MDFKPCKCGTSEYILVQKLWGWTFSGGVWMVYCDRCNAFEPFKLLYGEDDDFDAVQSRAIEVWDNYMFREARIADRLRSKYEHKAYKIGFGIKVEPENRASDVMNWIITGHVPGGRNLDGVEIIVPFKYREVVDAPIFDIEKNCSIKASSV